MNWISYKDQKPKDKQLCAFCMSIYHKTAEVFSGIYWCNPMYIIEPFFEYCDGRIMHGEAIDGGLHWLPLPELPEGWVL